MKEKLTRNIGLKILSIILATVLWLVITNVDDPLTHHKFRNIPVEIINENAITSLNQIYEITEGETIDFTIDARRSVENKLTASDFKVTADFSHLSDVNAVTIDISCPRYGEDVVVTEGKFQTMKVRLEKISEKSFKVTVKQKGDVADGYFVGEKTASPNIILVTGPKTRVDRITDLVAEVDVTGASDSFHTMSEPKVLDGDGNDIDASNLTFSENYIDVSIGLYKTKTISLQITANGAPANGYVMTEVEYEPKTIEVAGNDEALKEIKFLAIQEDITGAFENIEKEVNLQEWLPEDIRLVVEDQTAGINITVEKLETKTVTIKPADIELRNNTNSLYHTIYNLTPITVNLTGPADVLKDITEITLKPYISLSNYTSGTYSLVIEFELPANVTVINNPMVSINLKQ